MSDTYLDLYLDSCDSLTVWRDLRTPKNGWPCDTQQLRDRCIVSSFQLFLPWLGVRRYGSRCGWMPGRRRLTRLSMVNIGETRSPQANRYYGEAISTDFP